MLRVIPCLRPRPLRREVLRWYAALVLPRRLGWWYWLWLLAAIGVLVLQLDGRAADLPRSLTCQLPEVPPAAPPPSVTVPSPAGLGRRRLVESSADRDRTLLLLALGLLLRSFLLGLLVVLVRFLVGTLRIVYPDTCPICSSWLLLLGGERTVRPLLGRGRWDHRSAVRAGGRQVHTRPVRVRQRSAAVAHRRPASATAAPGIAGAGHC